MLNPASPTPRPPLRARPAALLLACCALALGASGCGGVPVERVAYNAALHPRARAATPQPRPLPPNAAPTGRQHSLLVAPSHGLTLNSSPALRGGPVPPDARLVVFDGGAAEGQWHAWLELPLHRLIPASSRVRAATLNLELIQRWSPRSPRAFVVCLAEAPPPARWSWDAQPAHTCAPPYGAPLKPPSNSLYASADLGDLVRAWRERDPTRALWLVIKPAPEPEGAPALTPEVVAQSALEARGVDPSTPDRQPHLELTLER